jgi:hypothetical protein
MATDEVNGKQTTGAGRSFPGVRLLLYYGSLVLIAGLLIWRVPGFREALVAPIAVPPASDANDLLTGGHPSITGPAAPWPGVGGRSALTLTSVLGALLLSLPVAWVLMFTRRLRYDPSLVHVVIILPIVVAGVVLVVKNSLALAFALAAIVAGVRFRQKLDEPEQVVYVMLALGIGLAAGVQALDIALITSLVFNLVVLTLWRFDIGAIYAGGRGAQLAIGDVSLLAPSVKEAKRELEQRDTALADGMEPDGILVVRTSDPETVQKGIEVALGRIATEWRCTEPVNDDTGIARFEVFLRLKKDGDPAELIAELDERWSDRITAAEYVPLGGTSDAD